MADSRMIRVGILTSEPVNMLTWGAEVFYRRLLSVVDDHGLYDARPSVLRSSLYPLKLEAVGNSDVEKWLTECVRAALVRTYAAGEDAKAYLQVLKFDQRTRGKPKFPLPDWYDPPKSAATRRDSPPVAAQTETETETNTETDVGGVGKPNEIETAFVRRLFDEVKWLVAAQINPQKRERLISLMAASGEEVSREILESAPLKCDKTGIDVWLSWSMSTLANKLVESKPKPKPKPIATRAPIRPSPNRRAS